MAKLIATEGGIIVVHVDELTDHDLPVGDEYKWLSRLILRDGSTILVAAPSNKNEIDLFIGNGGQSFSHFSSPETRTSEPLRNQFKLSNLQIGDEIVYQTSADSQRVRLTFTPR